MLVAAVIATAWAMLLALYAFEPPLNLKKLLPVETLRATALTLALLHHTESPAPARRSGLTSTHLALTGVLLSSALLVLALPSIFTKFSQFSALLIWSGLFYSIVAIVVAEQLYRKHRNNRLCRILSVGLVGIFIYDLYLFSHAILFGRIDPGLWQARGAVNGICAAFTVFLIARTKGATSLDNAVTLSKPMFFYTSSVISAGLLIAFLAVGAVYIKSFSGNWGNFIQITLIFSMLSGFTILFLSPRLRRRLSVFVNKHFFVHKYDYRTQWLNLIQMLTQSHGSTSPHRTAVKSMVNVIDCNGGVLWINNRVGSYVPVDYFNVPAIDNGLEEPANSPFCSILRDEEWIFSMSASVKEELGKFNRQLPSWCDNFTDLALVVPLLVDNRLLGFISLHQTPIDIPLTWEDLDLLKAVGREVASYLSRNEAAELLAESKQFDTYNKLSAFVMHDLKNLIAQQALVVKNADKHKENPVFIDDMIKTIDNSVRRMNNLLTKLQQTQPTTLRPLILDTIVVNAVRKCQDRTPPPSLRITADSLRVKADEENLEMIVTHIIKNAQEATPADGYVDVIIRQERQHAVIEVEDNGCGMDADFVKNRLFRPFDTTKSGKGMGIGVYQTREFIRNLGGEVLVKSELNVGTTFSIYLPLAPAK